MTPSKYTGLTKIAILEGWENWEARHPGLSLASYFTPAGVIPSGLDAVRAFSQGKLLSGLGSAVGGAASLVGLGAVARGLGIGARIAKGGIGGMHGLAAVAAAQAAKDAPAAAKALGTAVDKEVLSKGKDAARGLLYHHIPGVSTLAPVADNLVNAGDRMSAVSKPFMGWKGVGAGIGLNMAGGMLENKPPSEIPAPKSQWTPANFAGLPYANNGPDPSTIPFAGMPDAY